MTRGPGKARSIAAASISCGVNGPLLAPGKVLWPRCTEPELRDASVSAAISASSTVPTRASLCAKKKH